MNPFSLPEAVLERIFGRLLPPATLGVCSGVCRAWRDLPYTYLPATLTTQSAPVIQGIIQAGLHRCRNMRAIHVSSSRDPVWPQLAAALCQQRLPGLRELHIQHSSDADRAQLQQLVNILEVQGPACSLHLAVTDTASLHELLPLLPMRGLAALELNVPYLAQGMLPALLDAAAKQAAAPSPAAPAAPSAAAAPPAAAAAAAMQGAARARGASPPAPTLPCGRPLQVGLWVCCWGGCPGLPAADAVGAHRALAQVPGCAMSGCATIWVRSAGDLAALQQQLRGLPSLGLVFTTRAEHMAACTWRHAKRQRDAEPGSSGSPALCPLGSPIGSPQGEGDMAAGLAALLAACGGGLQELSTQGRPGGAWGCAAHPLAPLTGLTKLSLLKDWGDAAHAAPLPLGPVGQLTLLRELALERRRLAHPSELACLGGLARLRVLSLTLDDTAGELLEAAAEGPADVAGEEGPGAGVTAGGAAVLGGMARVQLDSGGSGGSSSGACASGTAEDLACAPCECLCCWRLDTPDGPAPSAQAGRASAAALCERVRACAGLAGNDGNPALLDWTWLCGLSSLEAAWLRVPHLDLACLPPSLTELDAQQHYDTTRASLTCSGDIRAPRLQRLVLPQPTPRDAPGCSDSDSDDGSDDEGARERERLQRRQQQQHCEAALLLAIARGCAALKELELVQWRPPAAAVLAAARELMWLRRLSFSLDDEQQASRSSADAAAARLQEQVDAVRAAPPSAWPPPRPLRLDLQLRLALTSFPWSSIVDAW